MTTLRIIYSQSGNTGKLLAQAVDTTFDALAQLRRIKAIMDRASWGSDWVALAAELGGGISATDAQNTWTVLSNALAAIDVAAVNTELERLDQG